MHNDLITPQYRLQDFQWSAGYTDLKPTKTTISNSAVQPATIPFKTIQNDAIQTERLQTTTTAGRYQQRRFFKAA